MTAFRSEGGDAVLRAGVPKLICRLRQPLFVIVGLNFIGGLSSWRSELLETISYARVMLRLFHALFFYRWLNNLLNKVLNVVV